MDDPQLLRLFIAIAEQGNLSAVARIKGVAPSTVTLGLKTLEQRLGVQLVARTTRHLSLTPEGVQFLHDSKRVLSDLDEVMSGFAEHGPLSGDIRITATNDLGRERIAPLITRFMASHPEIRLQLYLSDALVDLVDAGFDIGIRTGPLPDSSMLARLLLRGKKAVCASPAYWRKNGKPSHPRDLSDHNCIILSDHGADQTMWGFSSADQRFRVRVSGDRSVNDGQTARHWAIEGAGIVMKSSFDVQADIEAGRLETALEDFTTESTNLYAVYPPAARQSRRIKSVLDFISDGLN